MILVHVQSFGTGTRYGLEILHQGGKKVKTKVRKFLGLIPTFVEVTGGKDVREILAVITPSKVQELENTHLTNFNNHSECKNVLVN